jgi:hypothetical protein
MRSSRQCWKAVILGASIGSMLLAGVRRRWEFLLAVRTSIVASVCSVLIDIEVSHGDQQRFGARQQ